MFEIIIRHIREQFPVPEAATRRMKGGYRMALLPSSDVFERDLYIRRTYEAGTLAFMDRVLRPGDTMVDVGANLGLMTLHASKLVGAQGTVIALEPHPRLFTRLRENLSLNACRNVRAVDMAAGQRGGESTIYDVPSVNIGRASLIRPSAEYVAVAEVKVAPLDDILAGVGEIRFIKIDVEGFEAEVIKGAGKTLSKLPIVCMEVSAALDHDGDPLEAHDTIMHTGSYRAFRLARGKSRPSPLVEVTDREALKVQRHDNIIYLPHSCDVKA